MAFVALDPVGRMLPGSHVSAVPLEEYGQPPAILVRVRRGPLVLLGSATFSDLLLVCPGDAPLAKAAEVITVTDARGPWRELLRHSMLPELEAEVARLRRDARPPDDRIDGLYPTDRATVEFRRYMSSLGEEGKPLCVIDESTTKKRSKAKGKP